MDNRDALTTPISLDQRRKKLPKSHIGYLKRFIYHALNDNLIDARDVDYVSRVFKLSAKDLEITDEDKQAWQQELDGTVSEGSLVDYFLATADAEILRQALDKHVYITRNNETLHIYFVIECAKKIVQFCGAVNFLDEDSILDILKLMTIGSAQTKAFGELLHKYLDITLATYKKTDLKSGMTKTVMTPENVKKLVKSRFVVDLLKNDALKIVPIGLSNDDVFCLVRLSEDFDAGYEAAKRKDTAQLQRLFPTLYGWLVDVNHSSLFDIEDNFVALCRYIGKMVTRLSGRSTINPREIVFLRGGGETGITTFCRALYRRFEPIAAALDNIIETTDIHALATLAGKHIGVLTESHKRMRIIDYPIVRRITSGDVVAINEKFKKPYNATLQLSLFFGSNAYPLVNVFKRDEMTRFYVVDTKHIPNNLKRADVDQLYLQEFDAFLGYCYAVYEMYRDEYDKGGLIYKPASMVKIIFDKCLTDTCYYFVEYAKIVKKAKKHVSYVSPVTFCRYVKKVFPDCNDAELKEIINRQLELPDDDEFKQIEATADGRVRAIAVPATGDVTIETLKQLAGIDDDADSKTEDIDDVF